MSKATFFRVFKREFGLTPVEFIIRERLAEAKRLLRHPLAERGRGVPAGGLQQPVVLPGAVQEVRGDDAGGV